MPFSKFADILVVVKVRAHTTKGVAYGTYVSISSTSPLGVTPPREGTARNFVATYENEGKLNYIITLAVPPFVRNLIDVQRYFPKLKKPALGEIPLTWRSRASLYPTSRGKSLKIYLPKSLGLVADTEDQKRLGRVSSFQKLRESFTYLELPAVWPV